MSCASLLVGLPGLEPGTFGPPAAVRPSTTSTASTQSRVRAGQGLAAVHHVHRIAARPGRSRRNGCQMAVIARVGSGVPRAARRHLSIHRAAPIPRVRAALPRIRADAATSPTTSYAGSLPYTPLRVTPTGVTRSAWDTSVGQRAASHAIAWDIEVLAWDMHMWAWDIRVCVVEPRAVSHPPSGALRSSHEGNSAASW